MQWVRDNLGLIQRSSEIETLAQTVPDNGGVYFVPAFSGLYAPHWNDGARGTIVGLTRFANRGHIARAVLEATAFQTWEVLQAMEKDSGVSLETLRVDGGMTDDELLMQFQADIVDRAGGAADDQGDDRAWRGIRGGIGDRRVSRRRRSAVALGREPPLAAADAGRRAAADAAALDEGRQPLVGLDVIARGGPDCRQPRSGEFVGTFILILLGNGVVAGVLLKRSKGENAGWLAITAGWGFAVIAGVFTAIGVRQP